MVSNLENQRIPSVDVFRGLTMMLMVIVNYLSGIAVIPAWLKHAPDIGLTVADLVAPSFIFAVGLTYMLSFQKRCEQDGIQKATHHFIMRFLAIIGIGAVFTAGAAFASPKEVAGAWGVLQAIGASGLIALIFVRTGNVFRLIAGLVILFIYQLMLDNFWLQQVLQSVQGGLLSAPAWGALLLISTALAGLFHAKKRTAYAMLSLALLAAGIFSSFLFSLSKHRVSFSYILISVSIAALVFFVIDFLLRISRARLSLIQWWGKNPLMLYILHMILLGVTFLPGNETWYAGAPLWLALLQLAAFFAVLCVFAWLFHRKNLILKL